MDTPTRYRSPIDHVGLYPDPSDRTRTGRWKLAVKHGCMIDSVDVPAPQGEPEAAFARAVVELAAMGLRVFP